MLGGFNSSTARFMYFHHFFGIKPEDKLKSETHNREEMEWLAMQGMSTGTVTLGKTDKMGIVTEESDLDLGVPSGNKFGVSTAWEAKNMATPLGDLEQMAITANNDGVTLKYFLMRKSDYLELRKATDTINKIQAWADVSESVIATREVINQYLAAKGLPSILVLDPSVYFNLKDNSHMTINPWQRHRVIGVPYLEIGEMNMDEVKPRPILNDPDTLYALRTNSTTWAS